MLQKGKNNDDPVTVGHALHNAVQNSMQSLGNKVWTTVTVNRTKYLVKLLLFSGQALHHMNGRYIMYFDDVHCRIIRMFR